MSATEKYVAQVSKNADDEFRGRIQVVCADLTGDPETVLPFWIEPVFDWGWFSVPDIDEYVEIEVVTGTEDDESPGQSMIYEPKITWRAKRYYHEGGETESPIHDDFKVKATYGKRRGFATPAGHIFLFDDTEGQELVRLTWHAAENGVDKYSYVALDSNGSVTIGNKNGSLIYMDALNSALSIIDEHGNTISSDANGIKLIDKFSNIFELKDKTIQLLSQGGFTASCKDAKLSAGNVELGQVAALGVARLTDLVTAGASMATWITAVGAALNTLGQPVTPPTDFGVISSASTSVKAE